jgi:hypothetical protein
MNNHTKTWMPTPALLPEQVPVIETLHVHQEVVDHGKVGDADYGGDDDVQDSLAHCSLPPSDQHTGELIKREGHAINRGTECRQTSKKTTDSRRK